MLLSLETVAGVSGVQTVSGGAHGGVLGREEGDVPRDASPEDVPNKVVLLGLGGVRDSAGVLSGVSSVVPCRAGGGVPGWVPI